MISPMLLSYAVAVGDAGVLNSLSVKPQVVVVVGKEDAACRVGVAKLNRVGGTYKAQPPRWS